MKTKLLLFPMLLSALVTAAADQQPRIFITDSESWEIVGSAAGSGGTFAASTRGGARPQTAEIIKTFGERCPQVLVNNKQEKADYVVVLDHEGGKGYLRRRNKIAVFNKDGDAIVSRSTRSLGNSVQDACGSIVADWSSRGAVAPSQVPGNATIESTPKPALESHSDPPVPVAERKNEAPPANTAANVPVAAPEKTQPALEIVGVGTISVTSDPDGAEIFIDSVGSGRAPAILKLPRGKHSVQIVSQGYREWTSQIDVKENSIVNVTAKLEQ